MFFYLVSFSYQMGVERGRMDLKRNREFYTKILFKCKTYAIAMFVMTKVGPRLYTIRR